MAQTEETLERDSNGQRMFAMVMALVIDLDRPRMTLFKVNQRQMVDLQHYTEAYTRTLGGDRSGSG